MKLHATHVASVARHAVPHAAVQLGPAVPAEAGTVVAVRVLDSRDTYNQIEAPDGTLHTVGEGDVIVGALGIRGASRGYAGIVPDSLTPGDALHLLNLGGVIGRCTTFDVTLGPPSRVELLGAVMCDQRPAHIAPGPVAPATTLSPLPPLVLVVGTSMQAGKTGAACAVVRAAVERGWRVAAAKLTGVALRRDSLELQAAGACHALTFADAGLASTCGGDVTGAARGVLNALAARGPDLIVAELGDGLLGSYGVHGLLELPDLQQAICSVVLSATDPVAAWGGAALLERLGLRPTVVTGPTTDNGAGAAAVQQHTACAAANARSQPQLLADHALGALTVRGQLGAA
ncbi:MAG: hypothetical protein KTR31_33975 [Myxococcales bacterium]|nr:hypothetical protein [Myxococcales bacterium]